MYNAVFGKTIGNKAKHKDIKPVKTWRRRNYFVSDYHTVKLFTKHLLAIEMKIKEIFMNKPV